MSKSDWTLVVSIAFVVASFLGLPTRLERFKPALQVGAWMFLAGAVIGWVWVHWSTIHELRTKAGNGPLTLMIVGAIGAAVALALFLSWAPIQSKPPTVVSTKRDIAELLTPLENPYREVVAEIIHAFEPRARVTIGGAAIGPDGARTIDIQVWSLDADKPRTTGIDVVDSPDGKPVGIAAVDVADSKRRDLGIDAMLVCSATGFDDAAIRKAKRVGIGLIAALKRGDGRIKAVIEEEIYLRKIKIDEVRFSYEGLGTEDGDELRALKDLTGITYAGAPISNWLQMQALKAIVVNMSPLFSAPPEKKKGVAATFAFKEPVTVTHEGRTIKLKGVAIAFNWNMQWLSQTVRLDATTAIYDYRRGRVRMGPGTQQYVVSGVNFDTATPMNAPPPEWKRNFGVQRGELAMYFALVEGISAPMTPPEEFAEAFAAIEERVRPEDLDLTFKDRTTQN